jgi:hypothetical protein
VPFLIGNGAEREMSVTGVSMNKADALKCNNDSVHGHSIDRFTLRLNPLLYGIRRCWVLQLHQGTQNKASGLRVFQAVSLQSREEG